MAGTEVFGVAAEQLHEALVIAVRALEAAHVEIVQLDDLDPESMPSPDPTDQLVAWAIDRAAMAATLTAIKAADPKRAGRLTPAQWTAELEQLYRTSRETWAAAVKADGVEELKIPPMPAASVPVLHEVMEELSAAMESLRRLRLTSDAVRVALDEGGWS